MDIRGRKMKKPPACVQCRRRKIGCDRGKPICGNCLKNGKMDCFYPDVPGQYVQSNSSVSNTTSHSSNQAHNHTHARESASELHHNPELASMEQIREYNTRLQLLNAQQHRSTPGPMESAQFIPRTMPNFENKPVTSANGSALHLNWVQGPAIFDIMTSPYTQEEVLLKEMDFLRSRLLELQELTGKKCGLNLSWNSMNDLEDEYDGDGSKDMDDKHDDHDDRDDSSGPDLKKLRFSVDEFRDLDPEFLDSRHIFTVFNNFKNFDNINALNPLTDSPNAIFNLRFMIVRDDFLSQFYRKLNGVTKENFSDEISNWRLLKNKGPQISRNDQSIRFPVRSTTQEAITKYINTVPDTNALIPILKPRELIVSIEQLFGREPIFSPNKLELPQIVTLGQITLCLLLAYETLSSSVLIPLRDDQQTMFLQLKDSVPLLKNNLLLIKAEIDRRGSSSSTIDVLKYIALWKYYQSVSDTCDNDSYDGDEDVHLARELSINHESDNQLWILLWNFIFKNYCWRHLFKGEIPALVSGTELNSATVIDPLLNNDFALLNFQIDMVKYLQSKDSMISLLKVLGLKDLFKVKVSDQNKKCFTTASIINSIVDSIIYRNSMLFITYYLLMQYEQLKDEERFNEYYKEFLQLIQETLFYVFSNLANLKFAGYEFIFAKKSFITLDNISHMILGLYQRCDQLMKTQILSDDNMKLQSQQSEVLVLLLRKILMLLQDYAKNRKVDSPLIVKLVLKLRTILEYITLCEKSSTTIPFNGSDKKNSVPNAFQTLDPSGLAKAVTKLRGISESLIKSDFYNQRKPFEVKNPETLGITKENFTDIYNSFYF